MSRDAITLCLGGDLMTGRGVDQLLPHPGRPELHEPYIESALDYLELAQRASGALPEEVGFDYVWGDLRDELAQLEPDCTIVNLETSITDSGEFWPDKTVHYRMSPRNAPVLTAVPIDVVTLANNHVLDFGRGGLTQTLEILDELGVRQAGAGGDLSEARAPAVVDVRAGARVLVIAVGAASSGIPLEWAAGDGRAGVYRAGRLGRSEVAEIREQLEAVRRPGDIAVASLHWGPNWGFDVSRRQQRFARALIDGARVDLVFGHSSHHIKGIELHRGRPIVYGAGDLLDDYEGIGGYEAYRAELGVVYFATFAVGSGELIRFRMTPKRTCQLQIRRAGGADRQWLYRTLRAQSCRFDTGIELRDDDDGRFDLRLKRHVCR